MSGPGIDKLLAGLTSSATAPWRGGSAASDAGELTTVAVSLGFFCNELVRENMSLMLRLLSNSGIRRPDDGNVSQLVYSRLR